MEKIAFEHKEKMQIYEKKGLKLLSRGIDGEQVRRIPSRQIQHHWMKSLRWNEHRIWNQILPKSPGKAMQWTPPPASISTPLRLHGLLRQLCTSSRAGGGVGKGRTRDRGSFTSSHHSRSPKLKKSESSRHLFHLRLLRLTAVCLLSCNKKGFVKNAPTDFCPALPFLAHIRRGEEEEEHQPPSLSIPVLGCLF